MSDIGNSNRITRAYLDSLLIETRYMDAEVPETTLELYGQKLPFPILTAALSHLDHFMFPGAADALAQGAAEAGAALMYGMAEEEEIERLASAGASMIEIIKPYADRELIFRKIRHAENLGLTAVGIDIDHAFAYCNIGKYAIPLEYVRQLICAHVLGNSHACNIATTLKHRCTHTRYAVRYRHARQSGATIKRRRSYARQAIWQHNVSKCLALVKRRASNTCNTIWDRNVSGRSDIIIQDVSHDNKSI